MPQDEVELLRHRAERDDRRAQFIDRVRANIRGNYERFAKAEAAEERVRSNLRSNYEKLSDTFGDLCGTSARLDQRR